MKNNKKILFIGASLLPIIISATSLSASGAMEGISFAEDDNPYNGTSTSQTNTSRYEKLFSEQDNEKAIKYMIKYAYEDTFTLMLSKISDLENHKFGAAPSENSNGGNEARKYKIDEYWKSDEVVAEHGDYVIYAFKKALNNIYINFKYGDSAENSSNTKVDSAEKRIIRERRAFYFSNFNAYFNLRYPLSDYSSKEEVQKQIYEEITGTSKKTLDENDKKIINYFVKALKQKEVDYMKSYYIPFYTQNFASKDFDKNSKDLNLYGDSLFTDDIFNKFLNVTSLDSDSSFVVKNTTANNNKTFVELWNNNIHLWKNKTIRSFIKETVFPVYKHILNNGKSSSSKTDDEIFRVMMFNLASAKYTTLTDFITLFQEYKTKIENTNGSSSSVPYNDFKVFMLGYNNKLDVNNKLQLINIPTSKINNSRNQNDYFNLPFYNGIDYMGNKEDLGYFGVDMERDLLSEIDNYSSSIFTNTANARKTKTNDIKWGLIQLVSRINKIKEYLENYPTHVDYNMEDFYVKETKTNPFWAVDETYPSGKKIIMYHQHKYQRELAKLPDILVQQLRLPFNILPFISKSALYEENSGSDKTINTTYADLVLARLNMFLESYNRFEASYNKIKKSNINSIRYDSAENFTFSSEDTWTIDNTNYENLYNEENEMLLDDLVNRYEELKIYVEHENVRNYFNTDEIEDAVEKCLDEASELKSDYEAGNITNGQNLANKIATLEHKYRFLQNRVSVFYFLVPFKDSMEDDMITKLDTDLNRDSFDYNGENESVNPIDYLNFNQSMSLSGFDIESAKNHLLTLANKQKFNIPKGITNAKVQAKLEEIKRDFDTKKGEVHQVINLITDEQTYKDAIAKLVEFTKETNDKHIKSMNALNHIDYFSKTYSKDLVDAEMDKFTINAGIHHLATLYKTLVNTYVQRLEQIKAGIRNNTQKIVHNMTIRSAQRQIERAKAATRAYPNLDFGLSGFEKSLEVYNTEYQRMEEAINDGRLYEAVDIAKELVASNYNVQKELEILRDLIKLLDVDKSYISHLNEKSPEIIAKIKSDNASADNPEYSPTSSDLLRLYALELKDYHTSKVEELNNEIEALRNTSNETSNENSSSDSEKDTKINELEEKINFLINEMGTIVIKSEAKDETISSLENDKNNLNEALEALKQELESIKSEKDNNIRNLEVNNESLNETIRELESMIDDIEMLNENTSYTKAETIIVKFKKMYVDLEKQIIVKDEKYKRAMIEIYKLLNSEVDKNGDRVINVSEEKLQELENSSDVSLKVEVDGEIDKKITNLVLKLTLKEKELAKTKSRYNAYIAVSTIMFLLILLILLLAYLKKKRDYDKLEKRFKEIERHTLDF